MGLVCDIIIENWRFVMSDMSETAALANKVVDLLDKAAAQVGQTATTAFPYIVRYEWASALTATGVGTAFLVLSVAAMFGYHNSDKKRKAKDQYHRGDGEILFVWGAIIAASLLIGALTIGFNVPTLIEPTGATIHGLLKAAIK